MRGCVRWCLAAALLVLVPAAAFARVRDELAHSADAQRLVDFCEGAERGFARTR